MNPLETVETAGSDSDDKRKAAIRNAIYAFIGTWLSNPDDDRVADILADNDILDDDGDDVRDVDHEYAMGLFSKVTFEIGRD